MTIVVWRLHPRHFERDPIGISIQVREYEECDITSSGQAPVIINRFLGATSFSELRGQDGNCFFSVRNNSVHQMGYTITAVLQPALAAAGRALLVEFPERIGFRLLESGLSPGNRRHEHSGQEDRNEDGGANYSHSPTLALEYDKKLHAKKSVSSAQQED